MTEPTYSLKEIIELQFSNQAKELGDIKNLLKDQNVTFEKRFGTLESDIEMLRKEIESLKIDNSRYKTVFLGAWGLVIASVSFGLNKLF